MLHNILPQQELIGEEMTGGVRVTESWQRRGKRRIGRPVARQVHNIINLVDESGLDWAKQMAKQKRGLFLVSSKAVDDNDYEHIPIRTSIRLSPNKNIPSFLSLKHDYEAVSENLFQRNNKKTQNSYLCPRLQKKYKTIISSSI